MSRLVVLLAAVLLLAACTGGEPAATPSGRPGSPAPSAFVDRRVGPVVFSTPSSWTTPEDEAPASATVTTGVERLVLRQPATGDGPSPSLVATFAAEPQRPATEEVRALVAIKERVQRARDVQQEPLVLPGFAGATLVSYEEDGPAGAQRVEVLVGELPDGAVTTVTLVASPEQFPGLDLSAVALSARVSGRTS